MIWYIYLIDWCCCSMDPIPDFLSCTCRKHKFWTVQRLQFSFVRNADVLLIVSHNTRRKRVGQEFCSLTMFFSCTVFLQISCQVQYENIWNELNWFPLSSFYFFHGASICSCFLIYYIFINTSNRWCFHLPNFRLGLNNFWRCLCFMSLPRRSCHWTSVPDGFPDEISALCRRCLACEEGLRKWRNKDRCKT